MQAQDITDFTTVDQTNDPDFYSRFLFRANKNAAIIAAKSTIIEGLRRSGT